MLMFYICIIIKSEKKVRKPDLPFHCKDVSEAGERTSGADVDQCPRLCPEQRVYRYFPD